MADVFLSSLLSNLAQRLENFRNDSDGIANLVLRLKQIGELIDGGRMHEKYFERWLIEVRNVVYDVEDLLDRVDYEVARRQEKARSRATGPLRSLARKFSSISKYKGLMSRSKLQKINTRFDLALRDAVAVFDLRKEPVSGKETPAAADFSVGSQSTSLVVVSEVYGRDRDRAAVADGLLSSQRELDVVAIVGMGGIGKTTLAQLLFNDETLSEHFEIKLWVCVSDRFDVASICSNILQSLTYEVPRFTSLQLLQQKLREGLEGKRFFLVLDDVWNEDLVVWEALRTPFVSGGWGSKILVTTRIEKVARTMSASFIYHLKSLPDDDSWGLFKHVAFAHVSETEQVNLEPIGKAIVRKCGGLPLAVRAIAGSLRHRLSLEEWRSVLENFYDLEGEILPLLYFSYVHLPSHLKLCFAYCSLFPSGYMFKKRELILLWMAEGFLKQQLGKTREEVGAQYFDDLVSRSLLSQSTDELFTIHDLLHDLALSVSHVAFEQLPHSQRGSRGARCVSYIASEHITPVELDLIHRVKSWKTFLLFGSSSISSECRPLHAQVLGYILVTHRYLGVLSLPHAQISELPDSIGNLKVLHHLDLSNNPFRFLPASLCSLWYLETLILMNCTSLSALPQNFVHLINLLLLDIRGTGLRQMPKAFGKLSNLQALTTFVASLDGSSIKELGLLPNLRGSLSILELQNASNTCDALDANLKGKKYLDELHFEWSGNSGVVTTDNKLLENLEPHNELKRLTIRHFGGTKFPDWLGDFLFSNLGFLHLNDSENCSSLPPLGQLPSLEHLKIEGLHGVSSIGHEFYGTIGKPFQSLRTLELDRMEQLEQWIFIESGGEGEAFYCLQKLIIRNCPKLEGSLPRKLPSLGILEISECRQLAAMLPEIPDTCNKVLHYCDKVQLRSMHKLEPTHAYGEELEVSLSVLSSKGFPHSLDSSSSKSLQNVALRPHSYTTQIQDNVHDADEQVKPSSSQDVTQRYPFSYTFKVSLMAQLKELPSGLHTLKIEGCYGLESIPCEILDSTSLQHMFIIDCDQLKSLPQGQKRTSLKTLYIANCRVLQFPAHKVVMNQYAVLEHLCLGNSCSSLESFPLNVFPKLKILSLWSCGSLKNLSVENGPLKDLTSIDSLEVRDCNNLETFAGDGFSVPNLTSMSLFNCPKIRSLPIWIHTAMSLQSLYVKNCPELGFPPKEGLPSSLITLCVSYCNKITPEEWKLCGLNSLMHLEMEDGWQGMKSFPERGFLPRSLNSLRISKFMDLESLDKDGLQELASLESLEISCCDMLNHFPDDWPPNLSFLGITECSLLTLKLQDKVEEEWLKIAQIPCVRINGEEFLEGSRSFSFSFV